MNHVLPVKPGSKAEKRLLYYLSKAENGGVSIFRFELLGGKQYRAYIISDDTLQEIRRIIREINGLS